jgi:hypothetical protein
VAALPPVVLEHEAAPKSAARDSNITATPGLGDSIRTVNGNASAFAVGR